jgi:hypothetical protein
MPVIADIPGVQELWEQTAGDPAITIGLVESQPDLSHPCFAGADLTLLHPGWLAETPVEDFYRLHATFVASVLFGQHDSPVKGLVPRCRGLIVPALREAVTALDPMNYARAIEALADAGVDIIHFAGGQPTVSDDIDGLVKRAITQAVAAGILVVSPAGNDYGRSRRSPGMLPNVLAVGALDDQDSMYNFSNWGPQYRGHGVVAPGGQIIGAVPGGGTEPRKGTSVSAPIVTGVAALLASLRRARGLPADPLAVRDMIIASARPCSPAQSHGQPERCLAGRLDVPAATRLAMSAGVVTSVQEPAQASWTPLVYAMGVLGYDFGSQARRDSFKQLMAPVRVDETAVPANPYDSRQMVDHLAASPSEAKTLIWTLNLELTPVYAVEPVGPYAADVYQLLARLLAGEVAAQDDPDFIERVAVPGRLPGRTVRLFSGQVVPVVEIEQRRGLYGWEVNRLVEAAASAAGAQSAGAGDVSQSLREFLTRVYYDLRNLGATSRDRALNFAATNAFQAASTISTAIAAGMALDTIGVEKSPFCRIDSDCWDVKLRFFDPENSRRAKRVFRFTIDVSDILPVTLGDVRTWSET